MNITDAMGVAALLAHARVPACFEGSPGVGKSAIAHYLADYFDLPCLITHLPQLDAVDLRGLPDFTSPVSPVTADGVLLDIGDRRTVWRTPDEFPRTPVCWLLDEVTAAAPAVKVAAYQLFLDRKLGRYSVPDGSIILAAGNRRTDGAGATAGNSALDNRMAHIPVEADFASFEAWALGAPSGPSALRRLDPDADGSRLIPASCFASRLHPLLLAFLRRRPSLLDQFSQRTAGAPAIATPRSWEFASRVMVAAPVVAAPARVRDLAVAACVGDGPACELAAFLGMASAIPDPAQIDADWKSAPVPADPGVLYALCALLAHGIDRDNARARLHYGTRLPPEFGQLFISDCMTRFPAVLSTRAYAETSAHFMLISAGD